ncbi:MAG: hypothetical protein HY268_10535 [Deltaproteobacteria bacterium]|nr:hypothetical protein [Deltaproteobacteria bacterium]
MVETEELTARLPEVLADQPLREEMRRQGLQRARVFSWERSAHAALAAFEQLARNPSVAEELAGVACVLCNPIF